MSFSDPRLRHSLTSRLLYTCLSAKLYNKETLRDLHCAWAEQMRSLFYDGVEVGLFWMYASIDHLNVFIDIIKPLARLGRMESGSV